MFWGKNKKSMKQKPFGVQLSIELNAMALTDVARTAKPPSIDDMTERWLKYNCTRIRLGIAAINSINNSALFVLGSDGCIYRDLDFEIKLPFHIGPNKTDTLQVIPTEDFVFLTFEEITIMAFPISYIVKSLLGEPLVEYREAEKDMFGEKSKENINITSPNGEYNLPVITKVASHWFKYENTAVKVHAIPIENNEFFPVKLGINTD